MKEIKEAKNIILFIDELHTIIGAGGPEGGLDAGNMIIENQSVLPSQLSDIQIRLRKFKTERDDAEHLDTYKTVILQAILNEGEFITKFIFKNDRTIVSKIKNLLSLSLAAAEAARVYILPSGCIEHYYTRNPVHYMPISGKDKLFHEEHDYMQTLTSDEIEKNYPVLSSITQRACARI